MRRSGSPKRAAGECTFSWLPRAGAGKGETVKQPCKNKFVIKRVPYSPDAKVSGANVKVTLPDGRELTETVVVEDVLIVALGDSFMSGESNPDRPVSFSPSRQMVYDPSMSNDREQLASRGHRRRPKASTFGLASTDSAFDAKSLPRRKMEDEAKGLVYRPNSAEFQAAFDKGGAQWLSADCHRSQYGYPFRVGLAMTLENRHRAVTLVSVACSGADVTGLFMDHDARERASEKGGAKVPPQLDQLADLICRGGAKGRTQARKLYAADLQIWQHRHFVADRDEAMVSAGQPQAARSISCCSRSAATMSASARLRCMRASRTRATSRRSPALAGGELRYGPDVARAYLAHLDKRIKAVRDALVDGFGVEPSRVLQNAYEPIQFDEVGGYCGSQPTLGMDVHPALKVNKARLNEAADVAADLQKRLDCMASTKSRRDCPANLATGTGTGFRFITDHVADFSKRGICARDPTRALADQAAMRMPRLFQDDRGLGSPIRPRARCPMRIAGG